MRSRSRENCLECASILACLGPPSYSHGGNANEMARPSAGQTEIP